MKAFETTKSTTPVVNNTTLGTAALHALMAQARCANAYLANKATTTLVNSYEGLIKKVVMNRLGDKIAQFDDFMSAARHGFYLAICEYDLNSTTAFHTYAAYRMNYAISDYIELEKPLHIAHNIYSDISKVNKAKEALLQSYEETTVSNIAKKAGINAKQVERALYAAKSMRTEDFDTPWQNVTEAECEDNECDTAVDCVFECISLYDLDAKREMIVRACEVACNKKLADFLAAVLVFQGEGLSQAQICNELCITKDCYEKRMSRIKQAMRTNTKLREYMYRSVA